MLMLDANCLKWHPTSPSREDPAKRYSTLRCCQLGGLLLVVVQGEVSKVLPERVTTSDAANVDTIARTIASLGIESEANLTAIGRVADEGVLRLVVLALSDFLPSLLPPSLLNLPLPLYFPLCHFWDAQVPSGANSRSL